MALTFGGEITVVTSERAFDATRCDGAGKAVEPRECCRYAVARGVEEFDSFGSGENVEQQPVIHNDHEARSGSAAETSSIAASSPPD